MDSPLSSCDLSVAAASIEGEQQAGFGEFWQRGGRIFQPRTGLLTVATPASVTRCERLDLGGLPAFALQVSARQISLREIWWLGPELNRRHADFQSAALPTELPSQRKGGQSEGRSGSWQTVFCGGEFDREWHEKGDRELSGRSKPESCDWISRPCLILLRMASLLVGCVFYSNTRRPHASPFERICGAMNSLPTA